MASDLPAGGQISLVAEVMRRSRWRISAVSSAAGRRSIRGPGVRGRTVRSSWAARARQVPFVVRLFSFPELRDWLRAAGFDRISGFGEDGAALNAGHHRMIVTAYRD